MDQLIELTSFLPLNKSKSHVGPFTSSEMSSSVPSVKAALTSRITSVDAATPNAFGTNVFGNKGNEHYCCERQGN